MMNKTMTKMKMRRTRILTTKRKKKRHHHQMYRMNEKDSMNITKKVWTQQHHKNNTNLNRKLQEKEVVESVNPRQLKFLT